MTSSSASLQASSDYHALQTSITRRYTRGLRVGVAYTYADAKNVGASTGTNNPTVNPFLDVRERNYGSVGRRHNLAINYSYDVPASANTGTIR